MKTNLVDMLLSQVDKTPDKILYNILVDGEDNVETLTYSELKTKASNLANKLQQDYTKGSRVIVLFDTSSDFIISLWACLFAELIAVPVNPPLDFKQLQRLLSIIKDSEPSLLLSNSEIISKMAFFQSYLTNLPVFDKIAVDKIDYDQDIDYYSDTINQKTNAIIQYTSGSVGLSKGVLLNHQNLTNNLYMLKDILDEIPPKNVEDSFMCWLPLYHDMGLMSGVFLAVGLGTFSTLMSPLMFLQKPYRWLKAVSKYKSTVSAAPNFAYELCVKRITDEQIKTLDLSNWSIALNGAEAVRSETINKFIEKFSQCGFDKGALFPAYGLAESVVFVTSNSRYSLPVIINVNKEELEENRILEEDKSKNTITLVGVGHTRLDGQVIIVNPDTNIQLKDQQVGEIYISSKSIASKYWNKEKESEETFNIKVDGQENKGYLKSGDLGFIKSGQLFITGRIKDLIILRGRNYYPQHIEYTSENAHPAFRAGSVAAFSVDIDNEERLIIIQEVKNEANKSERESMINLIKTQVLETHGVTVYDICLISAGTLHKTSSGKVQRKYCSKKYLSKELNIWK